MPKWKRTKITVQKKVMLRSVGSCNGCISSDGRYGLYAPFKGGLHIVDLRKGGFAKVTRFFFTPLACGPVEIQTLIPPRLSGVHSVQVLFTPGDRYVVHHRNSDNVLRVCLTKFLSPFPTEGSVLQLFRLKDGRLIGQFLPHAQLKCLKATTDGRRLVSPASARSFG